MRVPTESPEMTPRLQFSLRVASLWNCLSEERGGVCSVIECIRRKIGHVLGQLPLFTGSTDIQCEQPKGPAMKNVNQFSINIRLFRHVKMQASKF